jgi:aspartyl-tRNA(Asn)/glutamyl-tRNA(Gln) amidotransferase subunit A
MGDPVTDDVLSLSAADIIALYRSRDISPVEVLAVALDRIDRLNPIYNAFVMIDREGALVAARASEERWRRGETNGLVDGLPVTVKDLVTVKGMPTRRGSRTTNLTPSDEDGPPVARLRQHGAVFLGKTTTSEFGWKAVTDSPLTGVTRNPWDPRLTPGGKQRRCGCCGCTRIGSTPSWHGWWRFYSYSRRLLWCLWF